MGKLIIYSQVLLPGSRGCQEMEKSRYRGHVDAAFGMCPVSTVCLERCHVLQGNREKPTGSRTGCTALVSSAASPRPGQGFASMQHGTAPSTSSSEPRWVVRPFQRPLVHFLGAGDDGVSAHPAGPWLFSNLHKNSSFCQFENLPTWIWIYSGPSEL